MIIVSQDRKTIVNFENITVIGTCVPEKEQIGSITTNGDSQFLGVYKTEERAKEVLQEIVEIFTEEEFLHIRKSSLNNLDELSEPKYILKPTSKPKVYEMPKE